MRTEIITDPYAPGLGPRRVLSIIERDPQAFRAGRRNNDIVNWVLAKRMLDLENGSSLRGMADIRTAYTEDFQDLMDTLSTNQVYDLSNWKPNGYYVLDPVWKVQVIVEHYAHLRDVRALSNLWLPMEYDVEPHVPENQIKMEV